MDMTPQAWPDWYDGRHINEVLFCQQFLDKHPMKCVRGRLFTVDGLIEDEGQIGNLILEEISGVLTSGLSKVVTNMLASIKLQAYSPPLPIVTDRIHVSNGTYFMDGSFTADKSYCNNRLTVSYNPNASAPKRWLQFLSELLQPEDIPTLQEFLGYCLLPTTKGQKMLMLIGKGGEGKSRIGLVMHSLLGDNMNTTNIQKVESNRFSRADLENKLLMVDDDMDMSALPKTNYIKSIVTSECKMDMERKGVQSYQSQLYVRFLCFGNGALTALHDNSDGFFRRQIVLTTKDRPAGRADDPFLVDIDMHAGDLDAADAWYREKAPREPTHLNVMRRYQYLTQAMVELEDGRPDTVQLTLAPLEPYVQNCARIIDGIHLNVLTAIALYRKKDERWRERLTAALDAAAEYRFIRTVSVYGTAVLPLLEVLDWDGDKAWRKRLMAAVRTQAAFYPHFLEPRLAPGEELTPTELQILHLLCADKSNAEIAQIMDVKLPTVKTHVSHILDKLDVKRRAEAKASAKKLRLIPDDL